MTAEEFAGYARKYGDTVYRVALNCCGNAADAEDIMQTVLPEKYRVPLYLYYYEDCPVKEVAALTGVKESTVQTRLQRAREKLKTALTRQEEDS